MPRSQSDPVFRADAATGEIRAEELTELVERLHRDQERLSVADVAETLGVSPEAVATTLRAMRSERMPPVVTTSVTAQTRPRRFRIAAIAGMILLGGVIFAIGHDSGYGAGRRTGVFPQAQPAAPGLVTAESGTVVESDDLPQRLRTALPSGVRLTVGEVTYTGAPGTVYAGEEELAPLIEALMLREAREPGWRAGEMSSDSSWQQRVVTSIENPRNDNAFEGLMWEPLRIEYEEKSYNGRWPRRTGALGSSAQIEQALASKRRRSAESAANRIAEWAESIERR